MACRKKAAIDRQILSAVFVLILIWLVGALSQDLIGRLVLAVCFVSVLAVFVFWKLWPRWIELRRFRALKLDDVDTMPGHEFEHYVARLLQHQGFRTTVTKGSGDFGVDVVAQKNGVGYAIQCKRCSDNIPRTAVSDAVGGKAHYKCTKGMVVTNRYFTEGAQELAQSTDCILVDRDHLARWVQDFQRQRVAQRSLAADAPRAARR